MQEVDPIDVGFALTSFVYSWRVSLVEAVFMCVCILALYLRQVDAPFAFPVEIGSFGGRIYGIRGRVGCWL